MSIAGSSDKPLFNGIMNLSDTTFNHDTINIKLKNINGHAKFNKNTILIDSFTAQDKAKGKLFVTGNITLADLSNPIFDLKAKIDSMKIIETKMVHAISDANITFKSSNDAYTISGDVEPIEVLLDLTDVLNESIPELNIVTPENKESNHLSKKFNLDLKIKAKNRVFVRGLGLDAELGGDIIVTGNIDEPDLQGKLSSLRGRFEEFGKQFTIKQANLLFQGKVPPSPYLDIIAQTRANNLLAKITITGYLEKPELALSSEPAMPQDQILARMMFGEDLSKVSPLQAIQITQSIRKLSGKGGGASFDPLGKLRSITKLDDITVDGIGTNDSKVGAGKYLSDKVYVKVEQGTAPQSGTANLEVEVTDNIYLESKMGTNGNVGAGISWGWDY